MSQDAVTVAPHLYKVVLENERVRVLEIRSLPGERTEMHTHPNQVAVAIGDGKYRFTSPDGQSMEVELTAGQVMYLPPVEHTTEIIGTKEARVVLIELK